MTEPSARPQYSGFERLLRQVAVVHPLPSLINAVLVACLALIAGGAPQVAASVALAMLGFQVSIGTLNDVVDAAPDGLAKPAKPIPAGLVSRGLAFAIAIVGGLIGFTISASFGIAVLLLGAAGYASGLAYDLGLRQRGLGWLAFSAAFPLLLAWSWMAAAGTLPPGWPLLLPMAAIAGPAIHLANSLVDVDTDALAGQVSLATRLGRQRAGRALVLLVVSVYVLAWASLVLLGALPDLARASAIFATILAALGVSLSWQADRWMREAGWLMQAVALALMAMAWLASVAHA